jgi:hypothetical protein
MPVSCQQRAWSSAVSRDYLAEGLDEPGRLGDGDELVGGDGAVLTMVPAQQRLDPDHPSARQLDLGLVVHGQLAVLDGGPEGSDQGQASGAVLVALGGVHLDPGVSRLGLVHGHVGALQQRVGIDAMVGTEGDPDTARHRQFELLDGQRPGQGGPDQPADLHGGLPVGQGRCEHSELIAAEPGDGMGVGQPGPEPDGDLAEHQVPAGMAEGVVDLLEAVQVDQQDRQPCVGSERGGCLPDPVAEQRPVGEAGERVMKGLTLPLGGGLMQVVDQLAASQRDARLADQRLEQHQVLPLEGADVAEAVGDQQRSADTAGP